MTPKLAPLRKILSILAGAAMIAAIFAMAALFGALVANATSPETAQRFAGVSYEEGCWAQSAGTDDRGVAFERSVNICD